MQYFVSIENTPYFHWQIELLIESFKMFGQEDNLVIGIAKNDSGVLNQYTKNLLAHKNKFQHTNVGRERKYLKLNKIYSLVSALQNGYLKPPFCSIHPDMLLILPPEPVKDVNVFFHPFNSKEDNLSKLVKETIFHKTKKQDWIVFGETMIFNNVPEEFFTRTLSSLNYLLDFTDRSQDIEKLAWNFSRFYHEDLIYKPNFMECSMLHDGLVGNFVHYRDGIPSVFHKKNHTYESALSLSPTDNPYEAIISQNPTIVTNFTRSIVASYFKHK